MERRSNKTKDENASRHRKYPSLKSELAELNKSLSENPSIGTPFGNDAFKIKISIRSEGIGSERWWQLKPNTLTI